MHFNLVHENIITKITTHFSTIVSYWEYNRYKKGDKHTCTISFNLPSMYIIKSRIFFSIKKTIRLKPENLGKIFMYIKTFCAETK